MGQLPNTQQTARLRFTLAVDRDYRVDGQTPTDFWPVELVGDYGARLAPHLTKGRLVLVSGSVHIDERREANAPQRLFPYVSCRQLRFLDRRTEESPGDS